MSPRTAWAFINLLSGADAQVSQSERTRLRRRRDRLAASDNPTLLLKSWLPLRAERLQLSVAHRDLDDLCSDRRTLLSGIGDDRAAIVKVAQAEMYAARGDLDKLVSDYLLAEIGHPNLTLHVVDGELPTEVSPVLVAADLADWDRPRELQQAAVLIRQTLVL